MKILIIDDLLRQNIAANAYEVCKEKYNTLSTGSKLANYLNSVRIDI